MHKNYLSKYAKAVFFSLFILVIVFANSCSNDFLVNDSATAISEIQAINGGKGKPPRPTPTATETPIQTATPVANTNRPFPQHASYTQGVVLPNNYSQAEIDQQVLNFYAEWKARYLYTVPNTNPVQKYVYYNLEGHSSPRNAATVSEAHGYGMVILAYMGEKDNFDAMYHYFKAHPSRYNNKLMSWQQVNDKRTKSIIDVADNDSATDGDLDIAYALLLADKQWGSTGAINYKAEALSSMLGTIEDVISPTDDILWLGDWATYDGDPKWLNGTRPSDWMFGHLRAFAAADTANAARWNAVIDKLLYIADYTNNNAAVNTGLMPDFIVKQGSEFLPAVDTYLESRNDGDFYYNACRVPWRFPVDYIVNGNAELVPQLTKLNNWIKTSTGGVPENIKVGYKLDGTVLGNYYEMAYIAPMAVSAMISADNQAWLNALWNTIVATPIDANITDYFGNTIKMQVMLTVSGNWWQP